MNGTLLRLLRIGAYVLGWLIVIGILAGLWGQSYIYLESQKTSMLLPETMARFDMVDAFHSFFSSLGNALFAFLIAAVIGMIEKMAPVGIETATKLMIACCLSYMAEALAGILSFVINLSEIAPVFKSSGLRFWLPYVSTAIPAFVPILYAASIFVLYTHFTRMVTFESEVA